MGFDGVTMDKPKNGFWERKDILRAQRVLDVWGTVKWHWKLGGQGVPTKRKVETPETVDEPFGELSSDIYVAVVKRGKFFLENQRDKGKQLIVWEERDRISMPSTSPVAALPGPFLVTLGVDAILGEFGNPPLLHALLMHRYPVMGPAARKEGDRKLRLFRPARYMGLICGSLRGVYMERKIDGLLDQMERDFLEQMTRVGRDEPMLSSKEFREVLWEGRKGKK